VTVSRRLDGERERLRITRTTKRELDAAVREIENARDAGQQPWLLENITVEQWLSFWLESILPLSVRWKTLSGYPSLMRVHVIPNIGPLPLTEVRPETLERLYRKLLDEGSSTPPRPCGPPHVPLQPERSRQAGTPGLQPCSPYPTPASRDRRDPAAVRG